MTPTKEEFVKTIMKLQIERKKKREKDYAGYLVDAMWSYRRKRR